MIRSGQSLLDETLAAAAEIWQRLETEPRSVHLGSVRGAVSLPAPVHAPVKGGRDDERRRLLLLLAADAAAGIGGRWR